MTVKKEQNKMLEIDESKLAMTGVWEIPWQIKIATVSNGGAPKDHFHGARKIDPD
jgi:hypothetical protein